MKVHYKPMHASIKLFSNGAEFQTDTLKSRHKPKPGKRGVIQGWSRSSRRRMRNFLLTKTIPKDYLLFGVTLTLPGKVLDPVVWKLLFKRWSDTASKRHWCAVWRLEVQQRGQAHWHLLLALPVASLSYSDLVVSFGRIKPVDHALFADMPPLQGLELFAAARSKITDSWLAVLSNSPVGDLSAVPGAVRHAVDVQHNSDNKAQWLRYLIDHASKAKQEQIGVNIGRHWGVIRRNLFVDAEVSEQFDLTGDQFYRFLRRWQRMITPQRKCIYRHHSGKVVTCRHYAKCNNKAFGGCLSWSSGRGRYGRTDVFTSPVTVRKLVEWSIAFDGDTEYLFPPRRG